MESKRPRLGVSACLLGEPVRYDGGHKAQEFLTLRLSECVEWLVVCPEVEAGLGTPREPVQLRALGGGVRMVGRETRIDVTSSVEAVATAFISRLNQAQIDGFVFKDRSPSCGTHTVPLHNDRGEVVGSTWGVFAGAVLRNDPSLPTAREDQLAHRDLRRLFLEQVLVRWHRRSGAAGLPPLWDWKRLLAEAV